MVDVAIKYADELKEKMHDIWFDEKYKYWNCSTYYSDVEISSETWDHHQFVSVLDDEVIGYICYEVNRIANYCSGLGAMNFTDNKMTFGRDLGRVLMDIFEKFQFNKLKFSVVIGNPIEKTYDKMIHRYGGRIIGVFKEDTRLVDGKLYDIKVYEILRSEYLAAKRGERLERIRHRNDAEDSLRTEVIDKNWIYRPTCHGEIFFKRIEAALGFKLFYWQKTFILTGKFRQYGETTAKILRELLDTGARPLDYTKPLTSHRARIYRDELREIQEKLQRAGIETRAVFWSKNERR